MKVLEPGIKEMSWPRQFRCPHCRALLELEIDDIKKNTDYTGGFSSWWVGCPECNEQPDIPKEWWSTVSRMKSQSILRPLSEYRSCPSHCCVPHGCKYGYESCPVKTGRVKPDSDTQCEYCWNERYGDDDYV